MAAPEERPHRTADPHPGQRARTGVGSLVIAAVIIILALVAFLVYDGGWSSPPADAVTAEGEPAQTEAPSGTEPAEPNTGEEADRPAEGTSN